MRFKAVLRAFSTGWHTSTASARKPATVPGNGLYRQQAACPVGTNVPSRRATTSGGHATPGQVVCGRWGGAAVLLDGGAMCKVSDGTNYRFSNKALLQMEAVRHPQGMSRGRALLFW